MPINPDVFNPPRSIGQGLTGILSPGYDAPASGGGESQGAQQASGGPFGAGGPLSQQADQAREGLAQLLQSRQGAGGGGAEPMLDGETSAIPVSSLGMPRLGGSPVSTTGTAAVTNPSPSSESANTQGGLSALLGPSDSVGGTTGSAPGTDFSAATTPDPGIPSSVSLGLTGGKLGLTGLGMLTGSAVPAALGSAFGAFSTPLTVASIGRGLSNAIPGATQNMLANFQAALNSMTAEEANATLTAMAGQFSSAAAAINAGQSVTISDPTLAAALSNAGYAAFNSPQGPVFSQSAVGQGTLGFSPQNTASSPRPNDPTDTGPTGTGPASTSADAAAAGVAAGGEMGRGGLVKNLHPGPGDDEPIMATGGEFVLQQPAVKKLGLARLMRENQAR